MPSRYVSATLQVCALAAILLFSFGVKASAQSTPATSYRVAFFNIKSGKGQVALPGFPTTFADTGNCTDPSQPRNAWGVGAVQAALAEKVTNDPSVISLGLAEAWHCANPVAVRTALGWQANTSERNGVGIVARYGFAGPEQWTQLDTSLNNNPADTMWVLRIPVCVDAACSDSVVVFTAHWYASTPTNWASNEQYRIQAEQTVAFMNLVPNSRPQVLLGDLNVFSGTEVLCGQNPRNEPPLMLQEAGYVDAWKSVHGPAEGATGMWNRAGCGTPDGYVWKRIDYSWSRGMSPLSMSRFGMVQGGREAPSDHAGIVVEYPLPRTIAASVPPVVSILTPVAGATLSGTATVSVEALDDKTIKRVEMVIDGDVVAILASAPYNYSWSTAAVANGAHTISAAATDDDGNRTVSAVHSVTVQNAVAPGDEIALTAAAATITGSDWTRVDDATAAGGSLVQNPDRSRAAALAAAASPASYVEWLFTPVAGKAYRLWIRGRAQADSGMNDAVFAQFTGSTDANGLAVYRIGTVNAAPINLEDCGGCGLSGWGWQDNGYPRDVLGPVVYFTGTGPQRLRIQVQEDGLGIDQVVLSSLQYLKVAPGALKNDTTIVGSTPTLAPPSPPTNVAPVVTLTSPVSGTTLIAPAGLTLQATATDSDNGVARVDFYTGNSLIGTSSASPFSFAWNDVAAGSYSLTARATDNAGAATTSAAVTLTVGAAPAPPPPANVAPTVALTAPTANASFTAPASISLVASATDTDNGVARVDFYAGAALIGSATTSPYSANWSGVAAGSYTITARATDTAGAVSTSAPVSIQVTQPPPPPANVAPIVAITSPASSSVFKLGQPVVVTASASDKDGTIARVEFYNGTAPIGTVTSGPYSVTWTPGMGNSTLTARAYDNAGAMTTSGPVTIQVRKK